MTLMKKSRDPLAGVGSLQEALRDMLAAWPFGEREAPQEAKARTVQIKS